MSLNVNGLKILKKKEKVVAKLKKEGAQIIFLQETHLRHIEHDKLKRYGYRKIYYSSYKGGCKRGVVILMTNKIQFHCEKVIKDKEGRYIIVNGRLESELITLVNIYAPPESDKKFLQICV